MTKQNILLGTLIALLSWFSLALTSALVKLVKLDSFQILLCQNIFSLCEVIAISLITRQKLALLKSHHFGLLFVRSMAGLFAFFLIFIAVSKVTVADATLLLNTGPFFLPFLLLLFYQEPIRHKLWLGIIPGFIGILLILKPGREIFHWHGVFALFSGVCVAVIMMVLRRLYLLGEPVLRILFYLFFFATLVSLPFGIVRWQAPTAHQWHILILIGVASFFSQTAITVADRYASATTLAPLCYTSVVFALLFDYFIWHAIPSWISFLGMILVIVGGIIALIIENQKSPKT